MINRNHKYLVSVIIPTYNRSELLSYTLASLAAQTTGKSAFEVVIGDDGSSDDTRDMVTRYRKLLNIKYTWQEDKGYRPASARNGAMLASDASIFLFVDSGILLHPDCIAEHIRFHTESKVRSAAAGLIYGFDHNDRSEELIRELVEPTDAKASLERLYAYQDFHDVRAAHFEKYNYAIEDLPAPWYYFWTGHVSIAADDIGEVGLFDENYDCRWGGEDNDLGFRLCRDGVKISVLRSASVIHYPHDKKQDRIREGYENCRYFDSKFNTFETNLFYERYIDIATGLLADFNELVICSARKGSAPVLK
jgi:glycosyltransferase involved in cell wall biosynthesis